MNKWDYLGLAYGQRLTKKEAQLLACAIKQWLIFAKTGNAIALWGEDDRSLTLKFLSNYMSKTGSTINVTRNDLMEDDGFHQANKRAQIYFANGGTGVHIERVITGKPDLMTSIGRVLVAYEHKVAYLTRHIINGHFEVIKAYFPSERFDFQDTTEKEKKLNVVFPFFGLASYLCCWKGGSSITDLWMADLEIHGFAQSFEVTATWFVTPY